MVLYEDNQAAICMARNGQHHGRAKHIDIKCLYVRENVSDRTIDLKYCPTTEMLAGVSSVIFLRLRQMTRIVPMPSSSNK